MGVCADDKVAGGNYALLRQEGVLHACDAAFIVMGDILLFGKLAAHHDLVGRGDVLGRAEVIHYQGDFVLVEHLCGAHGLEGPDGKGACDVIGKNHVETAVDDLPVADNGFISVSLQNFLR